MSDAALRQQIADLEGDRHLMSAELAESLETIQAQETHIGNQEEMLAALQDESTDLRVDLQRGAELAAAGKVKYAALAVQL